MASNLISSLSQLKELDKDTFYSIQTHLLHTAMEQMLYYVMVAQSW